MEAEGKAETQRDRVLDDGRWETTPPYGVVVMPSRYGRGSGKADLTEPNEAVGHRHKTQSLGLFCRQRPTRAHTEMISAAQDLRQAHVSALTYRELQA